MRVSLFLIKWLGFDVVGNVSPNSLLPTCIHVRIYTCITNKTSNLYRTLGGRRTANGGRLAGEQRMADRRPMDGEWAEAGQRTGGGRRMDGGCQMELCSSRFPLAVDAS